VPGYDDLRELHRGGQGVIYSAVQRSTRRRVAIKVLLDGMYASAAARLRFEREVDLAAQLRHPNIVRIYDSGVTPDDRMYYVMEYIEGATLDQHVLALHTDRDGATRRVLDLFIKICDAIHHAHQHGVIHRDLKPGNVRVDAAGEPHVLDFGLATSAEHRPIGGSDRRAVTVTGHFMGSLAWASPEQIRGDFRNVDVRSDVYALGVVLYQLLTARLPYDTSGGLHEVSDRIVNQPPLRPRTVSAQVSEEMEAVVLKCLTKEPDRRYQNAAELSADIRRYLAGEPVLARGDSAWYTLSKLVRRHRAVSTAIVAMVVLTVGYAVTMSLMYSQTVAERNRAESAASRATVVRGFLEDMLSSVDPSRSGYRVTVAEVLDDAQRKVDEQFRADPEIEASLRHTLGMSYLSLGLYDKGAEQLRRAVEIRRRVLGDEHPDTIDSIEAYAGWADGHAEELLRLVLDAREKSLGRGHEATVRVACNVAGFLVKNDRVEEAARHIDDLLPTAEQALGADHHETLRTRSCLVELRRRQGRLAEAEQIARRVLEVRRRHPDPEHRFTLAAMDALALVLQDRGEFDEAETLARHANGVYRRVLGESHPVSIRSSIHLVRLLHAQGRLDEAEQLGRKTLDICRDAATIPFVECELNAHGAGSLGSPGLWRR